MSTQLFLPFQETGLKRGAAGRGGRSRLTLGEGQVHPVQVARLAQGSHRQTTIHPLIHTDAVESRLRRTMFQISILEEVFLPLDAVPEERRPLTPWMSLYCEAEAPELKAEA
ncbi:hypothetical protein EYF80_059566 [Liparis tanakae]|uniref:Uncharacterized protein n=1 Tax=Liparis tanakae TaxID=230148 RepID=A0A4Z2EPM4_9TELE|nr:hypothetical protein EYF80_059566 [Liparis tanakae]